MDKTKFPKGEIRWVGHYDASGKLRFVITSKPVRDMYFLYEITPSGECVKLGRSKNPSELEQKYKVRERLLSGMEGDGG